MTKENKTCENCKCISFTEDEIKVLKELAKEKKWKEKI